VNIYVQMSAGNEKDLGSIVTLPGEEQGIGVRIAGTLLNCTKPSLTVGWRN
jgi:hypothetical protein